MMVLRGRRFPDAGASMRAPTLPQLLYRRQPLDGQRAFAWLRDAS